MSAIEELLTLLTEYELEHYEHEVPAADCVAFFDGEYWHDCWESVGEEINVTFSMTPEQAIDAALGPDTCHADETDTWECVRDDLGGYGKKLTVHEMECSACGHTYEHVNGDYEFCPRCGRKVVSE